MINKHLGKENATEFYILSPITFQSSAAVVFILGISESVYVKCTDTVTLTFVIDSIKMIVSLKLLQHFEPDLKGWFVKHVQNSMLNC